MKMEQPETKYTTEWFRDRAFTTIHKLDAHSWDYSDSLLLYISSGVEQYETLQKEDTPYFALVTKPEREYLQSIAKEVIQSLPSKFEFIDLGPGTEHKEQFFFDEIKKLGKECEYVPVDISDHYLKLAEEHANAQGIKVNPLKASFEELPSVLGESSIPRFVTIGLTFSNYEPQIILDLLKKIAGKSGFVFINAQMRDRTDMASLQKVYAEDAVTLADGKLKLIGLDPNKDVTPRQTNDGFQVWCSLINQNKDTESIGMLPGDKILVFQSLRYTPEQLTKELNSASGKYQMFDTGSSFIATLLRV